MNWVDKYKDVKSKVSELSSILSKSYASLALRKDLKSLSQNKNSVNYINKNILKSYTITCESVRVNCLLNISLFSDKLSRINLDKIINIIEYAKKHFNVNNFKNINENRACIEDLILRFEWVSIGDIKELRDKNSKYSDLKVQITNYRNNRIAHIWSKSYPEDLITTENLEKYLNNIEEIFNIITRKIDFSITSHSYFKEVNEASNLLNRLKIKA